MSVSVKQIGTVSSQLKSQIEQFQQNLDQNDGHIMQLKDNFVDCNFQLSALSASLDARASESSQIENSLNYSEVVAGSLQQTTASLDSDIMQTSRLWEASIASAPSAHDYMSRSFSSGRVAFSVPSPFFEHVAERSLVESTSLEHLCTELEKVEEYYVQQLREGRRPSEVASKVRAATVQKIAELRMSNSFRH